MSEYITFALYPVGYAKFRLITKHHDGVAGAEDFPASRVNVVEIYDYALEKFMETRGLHITGAKSWFGTLRIFGYIDLDDRKEA